MAKSKLSETRDELFQIMCDLQSNKITQKEAENLAKECSEDTKSFNKQPSKIRKVANSKKSTAINAVVVDPLKLTDTDLELAKKIKDKLRKTAETIVEIGESIAKAINGKPKGYKDLFYQTIGMSSRSAQRYMQIANHVKIQELKSDNQLKGKTMTDLLSIMSPSQQDGLQTINVSKVANGFYARYKNNPIELKKIMQELQTLIDSSVQE